jgi:hypothetical protein
MEDHVRELMSQLPYSVREKFRDYLGYVNDTLIDVALEEGMSHRLEQVRAQVELIFFLRLLYGYFVVGFRNYERMLAYLDSKEIDGFQIGRTAFTKRSPITYQWHEIARELEQLTLQSGLARFVRPTMSTEAVIREIMLSLPDNAGNKQR